MEKSIDDIIFRAKTAPIAMATNVLRWTGRATGLGLTGASTYGLYLYQTDPGSKRMIKAYGTLIPVVLHYRAAEAWESVSPADWDRLDEMYAVSTVQALGNLQGMYCKYGQTAAGFTNTFGEAWIREFRQLESDVPPRSVETVYETIRQETGKPVEVTFSFFDPIPAGSASIGQVHRAVLRETGQEVAVKVQYPEAQEMFQSDMHTIRRFCEIFAPEHILVLNALEEQNAKELDYQHECENLKNVRENMIRAGFQPRDVVVPAALPEHTTQRMLIMEWLEGVKLIDGMRAYFADWAIKNGTTLHDLEQEARDTIEREGIPAKYDGPSAFTMSWYRCYLQTVGAFNVAVAFVYNQTLGRVGGTPMPYQHSCLPPNTPRIVDTLMKVHGYQLMHDGVFNSDPHGGNFLLLPDCRIGLIDFGATKRLTRNDRLLACLLYAALARGDETLLHEMCKVGGYKSKYGKKEVLMKLIQFGFDSYGKDVTGGKNIQQFIDELKEEDPWEEVADNLVLAQFMSIRLRSLTLGMNHPVKCSDYWGEIAEQILRQEGLPYESWDKEQLIRYRPVLNMQSYKFA